MKVQYIPPKEIDNFPFKYSTYEDLVLLIRNNEGKYAFINFETYSSCPTFLIVIKGELFEMFRPDSYGKCEKKIDKEDLVRLNIYAFDKENYIN